mgnify:FL=1|jgi:hypothetical protein
MKDYHEKFVDARDYNASIQFWSEWRVDDGEVLINSRYENAVIFDEVFTSGDPVGDANEKLVNGLKDGTNTISK